MAGNESFSGILRLLIVAELFAYSDFYGNHPQLVQFLQKSGYSKATVFNIFLIDDMAMDVYGGKSNNAPCAVESLAMSIAKLYIFSSQFHILALSSVIGRTIYTIYPIIPHNTAIRNAIHGICYPRQHFQEALPIDDKQVVFLHIMWTRCTNSPLHGWKPIPFSSKA